MKPTEHIKEIYKAEDRQDCIYISPEGLYIRDIELNLGLGEEVLIGQLSDIHFNYCNEQDFSEADPVVMSTYQYREWNKGATTVPKAQRCFEFLSDADQLVINGDTMDYLSHGTMELMQREIWDKYPDCIATVGGHESARRMQGKVEENTTLEQRLAIVQSVWKHDIYYMSKLVKNKVLVVGMYNNQATCPKGIYEKLSEDITQAREKGYYVLIFAHESFATRNPKHENVTLDDIMLAGDPSGFPKDFYSGTTRGNIMVGSDLCDEETRAVYELIVNSADVVKGIFAGHLHNDIYLEIIAKTLDGKAAAIPQYIHTATAYDKGHLMRILVK